MKELDNGESSMMSVTIRNNISGKEVSIPMHSNKLVITQLGATGKTFLFYCLTENAAELSATMSCSCREVVYLIDRDFLRLVPVHANIIMVGDEDSLTLSKNADKVIESKLVPTVFISRSINWLINTDLRDVYSCYYDEDHLFMDRLCCVQPCSLPLGAYDAIVTESSYGKSEHLLVKALFGLNAVACSGRSRLRKVLRVLQRKGCKKVLLLLDVCSLGSEVPVLNMYSDTMNLTLYDYPSFEGLLYYSKIVQSLSNVDRPNRYRNLTMEKEYEELLERATSGTQFKVTHKPSKVSGCFLSRCLECCDKHDNNTLFKVLLNKYGVGLLSWYLTNYTGFLRAYSSLVKDNSVIPEQQTYDILMSIAPSYLGDLFPKCFPEDI